MKTLSTLLIALVTLSLGSVAHAVSYAGEDSARHYKSDPEKYDGEYVDVDCVFVTRVNRGPQIEGVTFFVAHTKDDDNRAFGGSIVVAVLSEKASSFIRKYGDAPEINRGGSEKVDSKRLRGIFHQLSQGHLYIDVSAGDAHALIMEHIEEAEETIRSGDSTPAAPGHGFSRKPKR